MANDKKSANDKKNKIIILIFTLALSILFIANGAVILSKNKGPGDYADHPYVSGTLTVGTTSMYVGENESVYYRVLPYSDGYYNIYSTNANSSFDPRAVLYDSSWNQITSNDDRQIGNLNFGIRYYMNSGETYYLEVQASGNFNGLSRGVNVCFERE